MILVRVDETTIVNMAHVQNIALVADPPSIEFCLPGTECYRRVYGNIAEASLAYEKLFADLASIQGVDGAVL